MKDYKYWQDIKERMKKRRIEIILAGIFLIIGIGTIVQECNPKEEFWEKTYEERQEILEKAAERASR